MPCASDDAGLAAAGRRRALIALAVFAAACVDFRPHAELVDAGRGPAGSGTGDAVDSGAQVAPDGRGIQLEVDAVSVDSALPDVRSDLGGPVPQADAGPEVSPPDRPGDVAIDTPDLPQVAQLIVGDTGVLGPGDVAIRTTMATGLAGFTIRLRDDSAALDLVNTKLIVIAGSVDASTVGNKFRDVPVPVIICEYSLFDNMGMTGPTENTDFGTNAATQVTILDPAHPLAAGLSGSVSAVSQNSNFGWGAPGASAARVAALAGSENRAVVFAYARGAQMQGGLVAPAVRVGFFALESSAANLSDNGIRLLDAAIDWALQ